jgi:hypothetical protein
MGQMGMPGMMNPMMNQMMAGMMPGMNPMMAMGGMMGAPPPPAPAPKGRRGSGASRSGARASASTAMAPYGGAGAAGANPYAMVAHNEEPAAAPAPPQPRGDMSFDQRAEISAGVAKLSGNNISKVVEIIRSSMPGLGSDDQEIEIDVNSLDNATLWRLHDFIETCNKKRKAPKASRGGARSWQADLDRAAQQTQQNLNSVRAARGALGADNAGGGGGGGGYEEQPADDPFAEQYDAGDADDGLFDEYSMGGF